MEIIWRISMVSAVVGELHRDTINWLTRVKTANGSVSANIQIAVNEFVKWCYKSKLRDSNNANHIITSCSIFCTENINGIFEKLFYSVNEPSNSTIQNSPNYNKNDGVVYSFTNSFNIGLNCQTLDSSNTHFAIYANNDVQMQDGFGGLEGSNWCALSLNYNTQTYFEFGVSTNANLINTAFANRKGLIIGNKLNSKLYLHGNNNVTSLEKDSNNTVALPNRNITFSNYQDDAVTSSRFMGGYSIGKAIPLNLIADYYTAWNRVQAVISTSRIFY